MRHIGFIAWFIFIGIAAWGNWFFLIMGMLIPAAWLLGTLIAEYQLKQRKKRFEEALRKDVEEGKAKIHPDGSIEFLVEKGTNVGRLEM